MPHDLTDLDEFTTDVTVPSGGDQRTAASVETAFQALANRTHYLNLRKAALAGAAFTGNISAPEVAADEFTYRTPLEGIQKVIPIPRGTAVDVSGSGGKLVETLAGYAWQYDTVGYAVWPIELPHGSTLVGATATVYQGNAGASGRMQMQVFSMAANGSGGVKTQIGSTCTFPAGTGYQFGEVLPVTGNVISNTLTQYYVAIFASSLAATAEDYVYSLYVNFDVSGLTSR